MLITERIRNTSINLWCWFPRARFAFVVCGVYSVLLISWAIVWIGEWVNLDH